MPVAEYTFERKPGEAWNYNAPTLKYNDLLFDGLPVRYNSLGEETDWEIENI